MPLPAANEPVDRLSALLQRFHVHAQLFHAGPLCGVTHYAAEPGRSFFHVLRRGEMVVRHAGTSGLPKRVEVREPSLLLYPRPLDHYFHNAPAEGSDFTCAAFHFDGGASNPLVRALPPLVVLPLAQVEGLSPALDLLFAETDHMRCGSRLLANRLFEVVLIQLLRWLVDHPQQAGVPPGLITGLAEPRLARTLVALHEQPAAAWSLERMARHCGMSRSAFAACFKAHVGQTPADYLASWRMALAQSLLREGKAIKAVASELGYANASVLSRLFTQRLGVSPSLWLTQMS